MSEIWRIRALLGAGNVDEYVAEVLAMTETEPDNVAVRMEAAYACDKYGTETDAVVHYDAAWKLGVPDTDRREFMLGYAGDDDKLDGCEQALTFYHQQLLEQAIKS